MIGDLSGRELMELTGPSLGQTIWLSSSDNTKESTKALSWILSLNYLNQL